MGQRPGLRSVAIAEHETKGRNVRIGQERDKGMQMFDRSSHVIPAPSDVAAAPADATTTLLVSPSGSRRRFW